MYATLADLELYIDRDTLILLTDDEDAGVVVESRVNKVLETASTIIDDHLAEAGVTLPLNDVPPRLVQLCCAIGGYLLHVRRDRASEMWEKQYNDALSYLEKVAQGTRTLVKLTGQEVEADGGGSVHVAGPAAMFGEETLDKF